MGLWCGGLVLSGAFDPPGGDRQYLNALRAGGTWAGGGGRRHKDPD